ncbi:MAG: HEPN domain-containing protein [Eubacterium sp.]|nr:HEPN domain-containing protein [Eubacterium sp.]
MNPEEKGTVWDLAFYRIETAKNDLNSARVLFDIHDFKGANNRAYYAIFHAISAVLALEKTAFKRHKDTLAYFNKTYVKPEIFPRAIGHQIAEAAEIRHASDYDDFYIATKDEALEMLETASNLIKMIKTYCQEKEELYRDKET